MPARVNGDDLVSEKRSRALAELRAWTQVRVYRDRASKYLELARRTPDPDVQKRFIAIAQHYDTLAQAEEQNAECKGAERRHSEKS
jgi:hypothetical protein